MGGGQQDEVYVRAGAIETLLLWRVLGGSMASVVGARFVKGVEYCLEHNVPFICFSASGGARMQEALFSLMQMAKTKLKKKPMLQKSIGYMLNVKPTGQGVFYEITDEKIASLSPSDILQHEGVSSSEIVMNFDVLFK